MELEVIDSPSKELISFFDKKIEEFNLERWEVKEKKPLAVALRDKQGTIMAGAAAWTFGFWLYIENLWVDQSLRGQELGTKILSALEAQARKRGCRFALLDTLNFQARPFYERFGYKVQWTQESYPREGCKHFMTKDL